MINLIGDKRDKYLEGEIILQHCHGHDTIIILFSIKGFYNQHVRILSENFYFQYTWVAVTLLSIKDQKLNY